MLESRIAQQNIKTTAVTTAHSNDNEIIRVKQEKKGKKSARNIMIKNDCDENERKKISLNY